MNKTADQLCEQPQLKESLSGIQSLLTQSAPDSNQYKFLSGIIAKYEQVEKEDDDNRKQALLKEITQNIDNYVGGNVVEVTIDNHGYSQIAIPYAFLTPLNVIFNWSLQNHSSYYTDIGFIWILCLILLLAGTVSSLIYKHRELLILHIVTICGWILWWFLASGIIWYAVGIIAWTTFCNALFISKLLAQAKTNRIAHVG